MKKSINKIRIKALKPIFATRSEMINLSKIVKSDRESVIELYRSFFSDNKKKFDTLFDVSRQVQDRLDYQLHLINNSRIIFSVISVLLAFSILILSI